MLKLLQYCILPLFMYAIINDFLLDVILFPAFMPFFEKVIFIEAQLQVVRVSFCRSALLTVLLGRSWSWQVCNENWANNFLY